LLASVSEAVALDVIIHISDLLSASLYALGVSDIVNALLSLALTSFSLYLTQALVISFVKYVSALYELSCPDNVDFPSPERVLELVNVVNLLFLAITIFDVTSVTNALPFLSYILDFPITPLSVCASIVLYEDS